MRVPRPPARAAQPRTVGVGAPLPDIAGAVVEPVRAPVLGNRPDGKRVPFSSAMGGTLGNPRVAPGKAATVVAARRPFPLHLRGQAQAGGSPEGIGLAPADA